MTTFDVHEWTEKLTRRHPCRIRGFPVTVLVVGTVRRFLDVRVMGLAAEMTYYALLSFFPLIGALGASLGFVERFIGTEAVVEVESTLLRWIDAVFSPELTSGIVAPMVRGLLQQERAGFALGSFVVSLFLASRIFRSAIDTLDAAYDVEERRGTISLWILGFLFSLGSIVTAAAILSMVVVGPLLGGGRAIAEWLGFGDAFQMAWTLVRMPVVFVIATAFLAALYRFGPNIRNSWRRSLPGAVVGMALLILISIGFRLYLGISGIDSPQIGDADEAVSIGAQAIGVLLAALLWIWLSGISILTGGVVNAELQHLRTRDRARESNAH